MKKSLSNITSSLIAGAMPFLLLGCNTADEKKATVAPVTHTVVIQQMQFSPAELTVAKGDTVVWINRDIVDHNVTDAADRAWASPVLPTGASWQKVVDNDLVYLCTLHPVMKGTVLLQ
jgi:plastocyanin